MSEREDTRMAPATAPLRERVLQRARDFIPLAYLLGGLLIVIAGVRLRPAFAEWTAHRLGFPGTPNYIQGAFRDYWESHDGRARYGLPRTPAYQEWSLGARRLETIQYFEFSLVRLAGRWGPRLPRPLTPDLAPALPA